MIKPTVKKFRNPQSGEMEEIMRFPNIFIYGLNDEERTVLEKSLPSKVIEVTDVTGDANCIVEKTDFAVIINPYNISDDELNFFVEFYKGFDSCTETIVFTEYKEGVQELFKDIKTVVFNDLNEMEHSLKYELLQALKKTNKVNAFSNSLSQAITILFAIRNNPYITTQELADKIEKTQRTVQRYIETLRCAGEWIEYDRKKKGWYLFDGKSILLDEI